MHVRIVDTPPGERPRGNAGRGLVWFLPLCPGEQVTASLYAGLATGTRTFLATVLAVAASSRASMASVVCDRCSACEMQKRHPELHVKRGNVDPLSSVASRENLVNTEAMGRP